MTEETVNPAVLELIELGNGFGGIRIDGKTREETRANLLAALERSRKRPRPSYLTDEVLAKAAKAGDERLQARIKADRPHEPLSSEIMDKVVEESVKYFTEQAEQRNQSE